MTRLEKTLRIVSSPPAMIASLAMTGYWLYAAPEWKDIVDGILSGGAAILAQAIYHAGEPREKAIHQKLDSIIHGTDADDKLAGIEEK